MEKKPSSQAIKWLIHFMAQTSLPRLLAEKEANERKKA
jgi:hypothetical protein